MVTSALVNTHNYLLLYSMKTKDIGVTSDLKSNYPFWDNKKR